MRALAGIDHVDDNDDARTEVYERLPLGRVKATVSSEQSASTHASPETLRPLELSSGMQHASTNARAARPATATVLALSFVVTACSLVFAFSSRGGGAQCAASAPARIAPLAAAVAPLSTPPPAAIPAFTAVVMPVTTIDSAPAPAPRPSAAAIATAVRPVAKQRLATAKAAPLNTSAPKAAPTVAKTISAPVTPPQTEAEAARDAAALARAQLEAALR